MSTLLIFGAGGHGRVVADAALAAGGWTRVIASDRDPQRCIGDLLPGVPLLPPEQAYPQADAVHLAIGDGAAREHEAAALSGKPLVTIFHPAAVVSPHAEVAEGAFVAARAVVAPGAHVGRAAIINHGAVVDHDVRIGAFSHIAPLAALGGAAKVGRRVLLGTGATVLPAVRIEDDIVIGSGAVVRENLGERGRYAGVPARRIG